MTDKLDSALDLMRRLPPQKIDKNLQNLIELAPALTEDLLSSVDQPLKIASCKKTGKNYLLGDYNRDGDSYRSPWSNTYEPPLEDGTVPSDKIRHLEIEANEAFEVYLRLYFENGVSSVYFWDMDSGFAGAILIKKALVTTEASKGCWDSIHVIEVEEKSSKAAHYKLTSTIMLWLETQESSTGLFNLGGSLTRMTELDCSLSNESTHIVNIGKIVENMENAVRKLLSDVYFGTSKNLVDSLRTIESADMLRARDNVIQDVRLALQQKNQKDSSNNQS